MERLCYTFDIAAGQEAEYERRHAEVWPELVAALREAGFSNYSLFRRGTEVIAYTECEPTVEAALAKLDGNGGERALERLYPVADDPVGRRRRAVLHRRRDLASRLKSFSKQGVRSTQLTPPVRQR